MGWQIDEWLAAGIAEDPIDRPQRDARVQAETIRDPLQRLAGAVGGIASQHVAQSFASDKNGDMLRGMARGWHNTDIPCPGDRRMPGKGPRRAGAEADRVRVQPGWPVLRHVAQQSARRAACQPVVGCRDQDAAAANMAQATGVVGMQVGQDHNPDISWANAELAQLWSKLMLGQDIDTD